MVPHGCCSIQRLLHKSRVVQSLQLCTKLRVVFNCQRILGGKASKEKKKMKRKRTYKIHLWVVSLIVLIIPWSSVLYSQGIYNNGALVIIQSTATVHIDGDGNGKFTNLTGGGSDGQIDINGTMEVEGAWTNNAANNVFTNVGTDGTVKLVGTTEQEVGGSNWTDFENLTLDNSAGVKMMITDNRVNGILTLTSGPVTLNSKTLIINSTETGAISATSGYILSETTDGDSRIQWNIGESTPGNIYVIPFYSSTGPVIIPLSTTVTSGGTGSGNITVATYPTADDNTPYADYPATVSSMNPDPLYAMDRFFLIAMNSYTGNPTVDIELTYDPADITGNTIPEANLQAQAWDGSSSWLAPTGTVDAAANKVAYTGISTSRVWVLTNNDNPLPIELVDFKAACDNNKVELTWTTATETNNDYFTIEKSPELQNWSPLADVDGAGNSSSVISYSYADENPNRDVTYYRLKQTDFDGKYSYSGPISAYCYTSDNNIDVTSMQITSENNLLINFSSDKGGLHHFNLYDDRGRLITDENVPADSGKNVLTYNLNNLSSGIYMFTIYNNSKSVTKKLLIQN